MHPGYFFRSFFDLDVYSSSHAFLLYLSLSPSSIITPLLTTGSSTTPRGMSPAVPPWSSAFHFPPLLTSMRRRLVSYCLSLAYKYLRMWPRQKARQVRCPFSSSLCVISSDRLTTSRARLVLPVFGLVPSLTVGIRFSRPPLLRQHRPPSLACHRP